VFILFSSITQQQILYTVGPVMSSPRRKIASKLSCFLIRELILWNHYICLQGIYHYAKMTALAKHAITTQLQNGGIFLKFIGKHWFSC
jgi:hypothetical protein